MTKNESGELQMLSSLNRKLTYSENDRFNYLWDKMINQKEKK